MIIGLISAMIFIPMLFGMGIMVLMNRRKTDCSVNIAEAYLSGFVCCIGIFEVGHLVGVFLDKSVTDCGKVVVGLMVVAAVLSMVSVAAGWRRRPAASKNNVDTSVIGVSVSAGMITGKMSIENVTTGKVFGCKIDKSSLLPAVMFAAIAVVEIYLICTMSPLQTAGDITLETVNSFLTTDEIYKVSPLTGKPYSGPPLRYEILCLPTIYTLLCRWFEVAPELLVNRIIPVVVMCTSYLAYYQLGRALFGKEKNTFEKRMWFLVIVAAVFVLCEGSVYTEGYGILHGGHLSTTWRNSILIPFTMSAVLEKKWRQAVLCILAEICIAWTLWGLGACLVVAGGVLAVRFMGCFLEKKGLIPLIFGKEEEGL